jgi:hypothetical protein
MNTAYGGMAKSDGGAWPEKYATVDWQGNWNADRPRCTQVASTVHIRSHQRRPGSPRVPRAILRSMAANRIRCSIPLSVGSTPGTFKKVK